MNQRGARVSICETVPERGTEGVRLINNPDKLLIVDIDGVLLDKPETISDEDKRAEIK